MPRGGSRPGAGRKPRAEKFARPIAAAEKRIADKLPVLIDNLFLLADGGYEEVTEHYEAAGMLTTGSGEATALVFPDKNPDELVLVRTTRIVAAPELKANVYLVDRILGKPTTDVEISGKDGGPIEVEDRDGLSDEARAERVTRLLERIRARAAGPPAQRGADLGATSGPADGRVA